MNRRNFLLVFVAVFVLNSCESSSKCIDQESESCRERGLNSANRRFSYTLMRKTAKTVKPEENIFLSPLVVGTMMSMLLQGADGTTKQEIIDALKWHNMFNADDNKPDPTVEESHCVYKYYSSFSSNVTGKEDVLQLKTANRIFGGQKYNFSPDVVSTLENLGSPMEQVNFSDPEAALKHINGWVSENTNERIKEIFPAGSLPESTVMALVSAIYFKGLWEIPFDNIDEPGDFTLHSGDVRKVPFMYRSGNFKFTFTLQEPYRQILELPYQANTDGVCVNTSMIIVFDVSGDTATVEKDMFSETEMKPFLEELDKVPPRKAIVRMPKFAITAEYDLIPILKLMNVSTLFSAGNAQLKKFIAKESRAGTPPLYVSKAVHKTYVQVDEKGTEAAAAAGSGVVALSLPPVLNLNRPFHFMIYDRTNDNILFIGRMSDPSTAK